MAAVAAEPVAAGAQAVPEAPRLGKKKLIVIAAMVVLALLVASVGTLLYAQQRRAAALSEAGGLSIDDAWPEQRNSHRAPPTFVGLEPFVVNLADKDAERFAQIGITLEIDDPAFADEVRTWMPAIRNGILMIIAHKSSRELTERAGKEALAHEILLEAVRTMGLPVPAAAMRSTSRATASTPEAGDGRAVESLPGAQPRIPPTPLRHVHFSSFLIQ